MTQKILPSCFAEISAEHILQKYNRTPQVIYLSVVTLIVVGFVSLFFVETDVYVRAQGLIKAPGERIHPKASGSGYVQYINPLLKENAQVMAGDTLIIIGKDGWDEQLQYAALRAKELNRLLADLGTLSNLPFWGVDANGYETDEPYFQTALYKQSFQLYCRRYQNNVQALLTIQREYERSERLFHQQVIAPVEFEQVQYEYEKAHSTLSTLYDEQVQQWRQEQHTYREEWLDVASKISQLTIQKQELTIIAPVTGSVQQLLGLKVGNWVTEGEVLMEISPDEALMAECYVTPHDIGLIRIGQQARLQIDAFNYNEWGVLPAQVTDIAHDVLFLDGGKETFFKVMCLPETVQMALKNGYSAPLKKGMTFSVRFKVARRTLFQLLYDKIDNWLNPNMIA